MSLSSRSSAGIGAAALIALGACGGGDDPAAPSAPEGGGVDAGTDAPSVDAAREAASDSAADAAGDAPPLDRDSGPSRPYYLASAGVQLLITGPDLGLSMTMANLASDVDLIAVHQEFYGVPWQAFEAGTAPPAQWTAKMQELASGARNAGKGVFLSVNLLNGARDSLAERTVIQNGQFESEDGWAARCYDFATAPDAAAKRAAYLRYVDYMVELFEPKYLNFAIEVNLFFEKCPTAVAGLIGVTNAVYDAVKAKTPNVVAFPSFQIDHLYGYSEDSCAAGRPRDACFDALYAQIAPMKRDRFGISSYPYLNSVAGVPDLPADWFSRGAARAGERPVVAETGWLSTPMVARHATLGCYTVTTQSQADARDYLDRLLAAAEASKMDLVTWWSNRDLVVTELMAECPCDFDANWCAIVDIFRGPASAGPDAQFFGELTLKAFGAMGIRDYAGNPKGVLFERWRQAQLRTPVVK